MRTPIEIVPYRESWPAEFSELGRRLRATLGDLAARIDHIGSTAVPGLAAKDVLDVQITVAQLDGPEVMDPLVAIGATNTRIEQDHQPPGMDLPAVELRKKLVGFKPPYRRANIHVREAGRFNQQYPLLCRDFLRHSADAARAYEEIKLQLAKRFRDDVESYYDIKDPAFDLIMAGAREWARASGWAPGPADA
ncbi:MAG: GrpB family protein [Planctomycetota bacterium]